jgi:acetyl-CoA carboxylase beta subunit
MPDDKLDDKFDDKLDDKGNVSRNLTGLWIKCQAKDCGKTVYRKDVERSHWGYNGTLASD